MSRIQNVFFDLDGTLVDPKEGITLCIQHALMKMGRPCPSQNELTIFIGPPLRNTFKTLLNTNETDQAEKTVAYYRERYTTQGIYENSVFPGVMELLAELHKDSLRLFVVTTKPTTFAEIILRHFSMDSRFEKVYGTELDGRFDNKAELIRHIFKTQALLPNDTIMVGDRKEDIIAGKENGTATIGVTYAYGSLLEISNAAPDYICNSPQEIGKAIKQIR